MKLLTHLGTCLLAAATLCAAAIDTSAGSIDDPDYEYVVVGSGAGGGPLACRLAREGHKTLLIEAGNDQSDNVNVTVPGYQAVVTEDPKLRWDIFVNHYEDEERAMRDPKFSWEVAPFEYHVGPNPPDGAKPLGILYPRAGTVGGCVTHNALIWITPHASDWDYIAEITGDDSWSASNMDQYLDKIYEWLPVEPTSPTILLDDLTLAQHLIGGASLTGDESDPLAPIKALKSALKNDPNDRKNPDRDSTEGFVQIPLTAEGGTRNSVRDYIERTVDDGFPLQVKQNTFVTKIQFDQSGSSPQATGVEYLEGEYLYGASPLSAGKNSTATKGAVSAQKEVIIAGGAYNTVQLLKLSGVGPSEELDKHNIPVVSDLPGVGTNLQDRYEVPVNVKHPDDFNILDGCHFDGKPHDECLAKWQDSPDILHARGAYATNGLAAALALNSDSADTSDIDLFVFGGPIDFRGYHPGWPAAALADHQHFSWYALKAHTRNRAGTVELRSADPLEQPLVNFRYFDEGTTDGDADRLDLDAMVQALNVSREALSRYGKYSILGGSEFVEEKPGPEVVSAEDLEQYVMDNAWGHHASCTCPIGAEDDESAVLDSEFRVRGVGNLRVVDASVFPKIPGVFIQAPIFMISEKAAEVILDGR